MPLQKNSGSNVVSSADYVLDDAELEALFNENTKMIILNTPNNPLGKVYSRFVSVFSYFYVCIYSFKSYMKSHGIFKMREVIQLILSQNSREELTKIAQLCQKYNVLCVSDEVYEWMIFDDNEHVRICTLPGMWERTITIGSAGKTFSVTGWKTGWVSWIDEMDFNEQLIIHVYLLNRPTVQLIWWSICKWFIKIVFILAQHRSR